MLWGFWRFDLVGWEPRVEQQGSNVCRGKAATTQGRDQLVIGDKNGSSGSLTELLSNEENETNRGLRSRIKEKVTGLLATHIGQHAVKLGEQNMLKYSPPSRQSGKIPSI